MIVPLYAGVLPHMPSGKWSGCRGFGAFEVFLDFFQSFALGFGQEEGGGDEVDDGEAGEHEEHGGVAVLADDRQENCREGGGNHLIDDQGDAHAVGADAGGHQFRQRQPDAHAGADGVESHEHVERNGDEHAIVLIGDGRNEGLFDAERCRAGGVDVGEGVFEKRLDFVVRDAVGAGDFDGGVGGIVGTGDVGGAREIAKGIDDGERGARGIDGITGVMDGRH